MSKKKPIKKAVKMKSAAKRHKTAKNSASKVRKITKRSIAVKRSKAKAKRPAGKKGKPAAKAVAKKSRPASKSAKTALPAKTRAPGYKVGDVLFYPRQGLCKFETVVNEIGMDFFLLKPVNGPGHATIRVPIMNAEKVGLRRPSSTMTFDAACAYLKKLPSDF